MDTNQSSPDFFSISEGGPVHQAQKKMHLDKNKRTLVIVFLCITWLPLLIGTALDGTLFTGGLNSFLGDVAMQVRLLVSIPMLLLISVAIENKVTGLQKYFSETLMKDKEQQLVLAKIFRGTNKLANSALAEILLLLIVVFVTLTFGKGGFFNLEMGTAVSWKHAVKDGNQAMSFAGNWAGLISIPVYQFLLLRWLWRYIVWSLFLLRLSFSRMNLLATHPDKAGGLGIIVIAQKYFCLIFVTSGIIISGELTARLLRDPGTFAAIRGEAIGYILLCLFLVLLPMVFLARKLINTKEEGLLKLSKLGTGLSNKFEEEWINDLPVESKTTDAKVSTSDLQDYDTIFASLEELRIVPFTIRDVIVLTVMLLIPYIPILFIHFSIFELLEKLFGVLM
jgi:hypothetical protein